MIGIVAALLPFIALAYKFGLKKTVVVFVVVVFTFISANFAIYLFEKRSKLAKGAAIAMQGNLLFLLFIPKPLKEQMRKLVEKEKLSSDNTTNQDE